MNLFKKLRFKFQRFTKWIKQAWAGSFNVFTHASWMLTARIREKCDQAYFEKAVMALAQDLLKRGVVSVHEAYDIGSDAFIFRVDLKDTFDKRKVH